MNYLLNYNASFRTEGGVYNYAPKESLDNSSVADNLIYRIVNTKAFRRLNDIRFLGALDYCLVTSPNGARHNIRYNRAQHSLGVARLAKSYLGFADRRQTDNLLCVAAALLHDIGHAPFSHTLEPVLKRRFGIDHHQASENIIMGTEYSDEIAGILSDFGVSPVRVVDVLNGQDENFDGFFSGPINFDTIEGILRTRSYLKMQNLGLTPTRVLRAAVYRNTEQDRAIVDAFWGCKDEVYNVVIRSKIGVMYDTIFQKTAEYCINDFDRSDFFLGEMQAFKKHPALKEAAQPRYWAKIIEELFPESLPYQVRSFYIEDDSNFYSYNDVDRYRQRKADRVISRKEFLTSDSAGAE